jgi:hypothetical protein
MIKLVLTEDEAEVILAALRHNLLDSDAVGGIEYENASVTYHTVSYMVSEQRRSKSSV